MQPVWKWLVGGVVIIVLATLASGTFLVSSGKLDAALQNLDPEKKPAKVRFDVVRKGNLVRTVSAPGLIEPRVKVEISAQIAARIIALPLREGSPVKAGDVVVRLDAVEYAAAVESARAALKSEEARLEGAKATFANATLEAGRARELYASKDIAKAQLDAAEADYARASASLRAAEFAIDIARANVARAEKDLSNTTIAAPFDGVITKLNAEVGELVLVGTLNNPASVIMEIADLSDMLMKAKIDESNVAPIKPGQKAKVFINAYAEGEFTGTVERVRLVREIDRDGTAYFETELKLEGQSAARLYSGLTANADVAVETVFDVLLVPSQAIVDRPIDELKPGSVSGTQLDRTKKFARVVFVEKDAKATARPVTIGASDLTHTIISAGLAEGERIVAGPFRVLKDLKDGKAVREDDEGKDKQGEKDGAKAKA